MLRHKKAYENLNSFKMKALIFLIFFFIASSKDVSTSKSGQSLLDEKEDFPSTNKQRKLEDEYQGGYITAIYTSITYSEGKASYTEPDNYIPSREKVSKVIAVTSDGEEHDILQHGIQLTDAGDITVKIYFEEIAESLEHFLCAI